MSECKKCIIIVNMSYYLRVAGRWTVCLSNMLKPISSFTAKYLINQPSNSRGVVSTLPRTRTSYNSHSLRNCLSQLAYFDHPTHHHHHPNMSGFNMLIEKFDRLFSEQHPETIIQRWLDLPEDQPFRLTEATFGQSNFADKDTGDYPTN